jgi:hypothetical protein
MPKQTHPAVTVSILAHNPTTNRVERLIHIGRVSSPATARAMLLLVSKALKEHKTRITF